MPDGTVAGLLSDADVVVVAGNVLHCSLALLVAVHTPGVGQPSQPHAAAIRRCPGGVAANLTGEDVPLGTGGAGRHRHLQLSRGGGGGAQVDVHVVT